MTNKTRLSLSSDSVPLYRLTLMHLLCQVAIKSIRKERVVQDLDRVHIRREIEITASLRHANIVRFHEGRSHVQRTKLRSAIIKNTPVSH